MIRFVLIPSENFFNYSVHFQRIKHYWIWFCYLFSKAKQKLLYSSDGDRPYLVSQYCSDDEIYFLVAPYIYRTAICNRIICELLFCAWYISSVPLNYINELCLRWYLFRMAPNPLLCRLTFTCRNVSAIGQGASGFLVYICCCHVYLYRINRQTWTYRKSRVFMQYTIGISKAVLIIRKLCLLKEQCHRVRISSAHTQNSSEIAGNYSEY